MQITPELTDKLVEKLIAALPEAAEEDYQAWLEDPSEEGFQELFKKYNIDANKIARATVLEEKDHE
jgi:hypothetical protein